MGLRHKAKHSTRSLKANPHAQAIGKLGGRKGGPARARALTKGKRTQIASHAAKRRWGKATSYTKPSFYRRKVR